MGRSYHSPKRMQSKEQTIREILDAAVKLHGQGITELSSVAREAGVSLATVVKYFPTREALFEGCTTHFLKAHPFPSPAEWAQIQHPGERLARVVAELYAGMEASFGQAWTAYRLAEESPVMAGMVRGIESFCREAARVVVGELVPAERVAPTIAFVAGMLSPLTYRSLRLVSGCSPAEAARWAVQAIGATLGIEPPADL